MPEYIRKQLVELSCAKCSKKFTVKWRKERHGGENKCRSCANSENNLKHGGDGTSLYRVWCDMRRRCRDEWRYNYKDYGGRGIRVCDEWDKDYIPFREWAISNGYEKGLQLDRKQNGGNYEPSNCHWTTSTFNNRNRRSNKLTAEMVAEIRGFYKSGVKIPVLVKEYGICRGTMYSLCASNPRHSWKEIEPADYLCIPC